MSPPRPAATALAATALAACAALALAACGRDAGPPSPQPGSSGDLAAYLGDLATRAPADRAAELARWPLDRELWRRTLVEPYRAHFDDNRPDDRLRALAGALHPGAFAARRHYAGDPRLTPGQAWLRWALPPLYPSYVVELDGRPLDTVFLHDGTRWRALVGLDDLLAARARAFDPACAAYLDAVVGVTECANAGSELADAALRITPAAPAAPPTPPAPTARERFDRACRIAASLCGKRSQ